MSDEIIEKEKKVKDTERLYTNLRAVLSRQPDPQAAVNLDKAQDALRKRGIKLKVRGSTRYERGFKGGFVIPRYSSSYRLESVLPVISAREIPAFEISFAVSREILIPVLRNAASAR